MNNLLSNISGIKQFNLSDIYFLHNNSSNTKDDSSHITFELYVVMVFFLFCCYYCCRKICRTQSKYNKKIILDKFYEPYLITDKSDNICSICLEKINMNKDAVKLNNCSHIYHIKCIDPWLLENQTCPNCRQETQSLIN